MDKILLIVIAFTSVILSNEVLLADPDIVSSGLEYNKTVQLMLGEEVTFKGITLSGLIHVRNEERFNKGLFPNHNWRGIVAINYNADSLFKSLPFSLSLGLKHESAHPTMGIQCNESHYYEKIYDGQYRRYLLNSIDLSLEKLLKVKKLNLLFDINYHFYFYSKNTPELSGMQATISNGFSGGMEFKFNFKNHFIFISLFDRIILTGSQKGHSEVFYNLNYASSVNYPIINKINTVKTKVGISLNLFKINRRLNIFSSVLYGNIFGFIDSREKRTQLTFIGLELVH